MDHPSADYLYHWRLAPRAGPGEPLLACSAPPTSAVLDDLRWIYGTEPSFELVSDAELSLRLDALERHDDSAADLIASLKEEGRPADNIAEQDLRERAHEAPVIRLVNLILAEAIEARASDVHVENGARGVTVRYRVDGVLLDGPAPPPTLAPALLARLKIMADMDIAERRRPQDGRVRLRLGDRVVDVRLSTLPSLGGESVVIRILESNPQLFTFDELGMAKSVQQTLQRLLALPHGVILATGPTGSGKTTTLYAALALRRTGREKIVTVEDPVEYAVDGVTQIPVNRQAGVDFGSALRSILRHDPDVILVGEMRDAETTQICIQAALTGHLVLSTLHTNDAAGAVTRLLELGVEPYLVANTVIAVLAQRLVRVTCPFCSREERLTAALAARLAAWSTTGCAARGSGCEHCRGTGYRGRTGIYELLVLDDALRECLLEPTRRRHLRQLWRDQGHASLREDGFRQIALGVTTPEEVFRVTFE